MMPSLKELLDDSESAVREILLKKGVKALTPAFRLVDAEGNSTIVLAPWASDEEKVRCVKEVAAIAARIGAKALSLLVEQWLATYDRHQPLTRRPRDRDDRIEVVGIIATDGRDTRARFLDMVRGDDGNLTGLPFREEIDGATARFPLIEGIL